MSSMMLAEVQARRGVLANVIGPYAPWYLLYFAKSEQIRWWYHQPELGKTAAPTPVSSGTNDGQMMRMMLVELRAQGGAYYQSW